jgi:hypothetical protein
MLFEVIIFALLKNEEIVMSKSVLSICLAGVLFTGCFLDSDDENESVASSGGESSSVIVGSSSSVTDVEGEKTAMELRLEHINTLPKYLNSALWFGKVKEVKWKTSSCGDFQTVEDCRAYGKKSKKYSSDFYNEKGGLTSTYQFDSLGVKVEGESREFVWEGGLPVSTKIELIDRSYDEENQLVEVFKSYEEIISWNEKKDVASLIRNDTLIQKIFVSGSAMDSIYVFKDYNGELEYPSVSYNDETTWWTGQKEYNDSLGKNVRIHERIIEYDSEARLLGGTATLFGGCYKEGVDTCNFPKAEISAGDYDSEGNPSYWAIRSPLLDSLENVTGFSVWMFELEFEYWE